METAELLLLRFKGMESARSVYESTWRELAQMFDPIKGLGFGTDIQAGEAGDEHIWDSTPVSAKGMMDARVFGMLMDPSSRWLGLGFRDIRNELDEGDEFQKWAAQATEIMLEVFANEETNFYTAGAEAIECESLFGLSCKYTEADDESLIRVRAIPLSEVYISESARGVVDTVYRKYKMTARQMVQEWGETKVSKEVRDLMDENKPETEVEILHCTYPRSDISPKAKGNQAMPYACVYMEFKSKHILEEKGYHEFPYSCPRWDKSAGEIYGRGAALPALADARVLYAMARSALMAAEKMSDPPLMVPDDGFLGPINSGPGGISYYRSGTQDKIEALPVRVDLGAIEAMADAKRKAVREWFYSNQFDDSSRPNMTATEAQLKYSERWKTLAAVLGRAQSEDLTPQIRRVLAILMREGVIPPMPEGYTERNIKFYYTGPLTQAQKQAGIQSMNMLMEQAMAASQIPGFEEITDNFIPDKIAGHMFDASGAPADVKRSKREVEGIREQRAQKMQAQAALVQADAVANTAKTASQADMSKPNGLTAIMGGAG